MSRSFSLKAAAAFVLASCLWSPHADAAHIADRSETVASEAGGQKRERAAKDVYLDGVRNARRATVAVLGAISMSRSDYDHPDNVGAAMHGTGFHVGGGYIVTVRHAIASSFRGKVYFRPEIKVMLENMEEHSATLVGVNDAIDAAVYKIDLSKVKSPLTAVKFAAREPAMGEDLYTFGFPGGAERARGYGGGIFSAGKAGNESIYLPKTVDIRLMQVDIPVCLGSSGSGVFNEQGEVVGVMQSFVQTHENEKEPQCGRLGMAVPGPIVKHVVEAIIGGGNVKFPVMGVKLKVNRLRDEWKVAAAEVSGAAAAAGMLEDDFILAVNGTPVTTTTQLQSYLMEKTHPGEMVKVKISRGGEEKTLTFALGSGS
ncbi:MAG: trypsin-like peptidase domain-containing protein [Proteobacteria bacterium]|nr:trypsin-like peptidase domain-containing protein [Pseudomonadota bacterium]